MDTADGQPEAEVAEEPLAEPDSEDTEVDTPEEEEEESAEPAEEEADEDTESEGAEEEDEEEQPEHDEPEVEVTAAYESEDPRVQAYLAKYQGDVEKALTAAAHLESAYGRQGQDKAVYQRRVQELEQQLQQAQTFSAGGILTPEQRDWAAQAVQSDRPEGYVQEAIRAGEFALARAVCDGWAEDSPYEAARAAQTVDAVEWQARAQEQVPEEVPYDQGTLLEVLAENFPDMP